MRRLLLIVLYILGGAASVQQSSPLLDLNFTQRPPGSYLVFCTPHFPEERMTQVHWKEKHDNGTYSVIAVLNPQWGNYTKLSYQEAVKLHKKDGKTYIIEIKEQEICVCCEVVTFPSGRIHENCLTIGGDSDEYSSRYAVLGILLVGGLFVLGSLVLICHICWMRKSNCRVFNLRSERQQPWTGSRRSQVPYRRTSPSVNLAYEPSHDTDLHSDTPPPARAHLLHAHPTIQLPSEDPPTRNPTINRDWPSEGLSIRNPTPPDVPPLRNQVIHKVLPAPQPIYNNIPHHNKYYPKVRNVKSLQIEPTINQHHQEMFSYEDTDPSSSIPHYHTRSCPWLFEGTSYPSEDIASPHSTRLNVPRTPESPFTTINPMYHSGAGWASHPNHAHLKYEHSMIS